ncbi:ERAP1-like C-terminal domain-containing protein, partial [Burkholderia multivorans]|uniref:ERAP1-like C-terminal domain-containing protein n=1 Tax=Burkholderia multivorans TaxID=87883 RepID=UPI0015ECA243
TDIARETHLDQSSSGRLRAETANAALPLPIVKMRAWETVVTGSLSNDVLSAIISGFVAPSALPITEMYVDEYFERLAGFWADNSIEIARRLVLGLYPRWSVDEERVVEITGNGQDWEGRLGALTAAVRTGLGPDAEVDG